MATFSASTSGSEVDMNNLPYFEGRTQTTTSSKITVSATFERQDYYGSFTYTQTGSGVAGTINSTYYTSSLFSGVDYAITGFSADANAALTLIGTRQVVQFESIILGGKDSIIGSNYADNLLAFAGNDSITGGAGNDMIDGGAGIDTVYVSGLRSASTITKTLTGYKVASTAGSGTDTLINVERICFEDKAIALDADGNAGQAYRLYQAAFNRKPDLGGLGVWMNQLDNGQSLDWVSAQFQNSAEFKLKYGTNVSTDQFVTLLYQNVLHRAPDAGGLAAWIGLLDAGGQTRAQVLTGFSESPENKAALIGVIQNGMEFIPVA